MPCSEILSACGPRVGAAAASPYRRSDPPQSSAAGRGGSATGAAIFFANSLVEARSHSQAEHEQHGLVAHLAQFGRELVAPPRDRAQPSKNRDVLLASGLERHRRGIEAGAN